MAEKSNAPFVSVIVPAYNSQCSIEECLQSLMNQNYPGDRYEVIVVNDGSTDRTADILEGCFQSNRIRVIHHKENEGLAAARNTGIRSSKGDILIFLDSDMIADENFLTEAVATLSRSNAVGVVGRRLPHISIPMDKYQKYRYFSKIGAERISNTEAPVPFRYFILGISGIKRKVTDEIGLFNEDIKKWGGEDNELACRVHRLYPEGLYYNPEMIAYHKHYRPFKDELANIYNFARYNLPKLSKLYPEIARIYYLHFAPRSQSGFTIFKLCGRILITNFIWGTGLFLYDVLPHPLSVIAIKLLIANRLLKGFCDGLYIER